MAKITKWTATTPAMSHHRDGLQCLRLTQALRRRDQLRLCLRCRFAIWRGLAADNRRSVNSAPRTHLAAKPSHVALLSGDRVSLEIANQQTDGMKRKHSTRDLDFRARH
jgi:hypothetical protein